MITELTYFLIASALGLLFIYLTMKLLDQWKMKRLRKKFPDGTETKTKFVNRLDEIPTDNSTAEELISKLAE
jgi:hypothetical protein